MRLRLKRLVCRWFGHRWIIETYAVGPPDYVRPGLIREWRCGRCPAGDVEFTPTHV